MQSYLTLQRVLYLKTLLQPFFTVEPSDVEVEEGHHLIMECHALSFPVATYHWYKLHHRTDVSFVADNCYQLLTFSV